MRRRTPPPLWFWALVAGVVVCVTWHTGGYARPAPPVSLAFFQFIIPIAMAIWHGLEAAGRVTLALLSMSVNALWVFARKVYGGLADLGGSLLSGFRESWRFLRALYDDVLKPAWGKFWSFVDWTRDSLARVFGPVFKALFRIRTELLKFYDRFVRPILDTIDVARRALRVLGAMGIDWAKTLDAKLGQLEEKIDAPFRLLLREINKVINLVNRVVTADGLFQRLALIRSIERDFSYLVRVSWARQSRSLTTEERAAAAKPLERRTPEEHAAEAARLIRFSEGPLAARAEEVVADLRIMFGARAKHTGQF